MMYIADSPLLLPSTSIEALRGSETAKVCKFRSSATEVKDFALEGDDDRGYSSLQALPHLQRNSPSIQGLSPPPAFQDLENDQRSFLSRRRGPMIEVNSSQTSLQTMNRDGMSDTTGPTDDSDHESNVQVTHPVIHESSLGEFGNFISSAKELEGHLEKFTHAVQKLGSALGLSRASLELNRALKSVREYFEQNSRDLLGIVLKKLGERHKARARRPINIARRKRRTRKDKSQYGGTLAYTYQNDLSEHLDELYATLEKFSIAVGDFEEYVDNDGAAALSALMIEIKVLSVGLSYFGIDGDSKELRRFVAAKSMKMKRHLVRMSSAVKRFIDVGIPCISYAQKRSSTTLNSAAAIATFFAGVSARTLQFSVELVTKPIEVSVNTLWISSLVLSIGSAVNALLALTWRQAVYSSPKQALPWYVRFWVRQGYLVLLVASVIAFLAGLILFVWDTQRRIAAWIVIAFTAFCAIGLINVSLWFGWERWTFAQFRRQQRITLIPEDDSRIWDWIKYVYEKVLMHKQDGHFVENEDSSAILPHHRRRVTSPEPTDTLGEQVKNGFKTALRQLSIFSLPAESNNRHSHQTGHSIGHDEEKRPGGSRRSTGRMTRSHSDPLARRAHQVTLEADRPSREEFARNLQDMSFRRVAPSLNRVKHMQFSPCGRWLVVCYRYSCRVFDVENNFSSHQSLKHRKNVTQVEWSPKGHHLLTRYKDGVKLWRVDGSDFVVDKEYKLVNGMNDIQWLTDNEFLALADDANTLFRVSLDGDLHGNILPWDLRIYEMYSLPDSDRILFIASKEIEGLPEDKAIDCIIVYTMGFSDTTSNYSRSSVSVGTSVSWKTEGKIERKIPLTEDVESLTVCPEHNFLLVSYENKPPEIWMLSEDLTKISFAHELAIPEGVILDEDVSWGDAFFMGPGYGVIGCVSDDLMHFWDLESQQHLRYISVTDSDEEIEEYPVFSFNRMQKALTFPMMASATKLGVVKIWTSKNLGKDKPEKLQLSTEIEEIEDVVDDIPLATSPTQMRTQPVGSTGTKEQ